MIYDRSRGLPFCGRPVEERACLKKEFLLLKYPLGILPSRYFQQKKIDSVVLFEEHPAFLLGTSLDYLHGESVDWINELDFIELEIAFLYRLLRMEIPSHISPSDELVNIEKELVSFHADSVQRLKDDLENHENELALILKTKTGIDDHEFRNKHKAFFKRVDAIDRNYKELKKRVFSLVQRN
jgi:hypothetical protein